jgi:hypothetical protein
MSGCRTALVEGSVTDLPVQVVPYPVSAISGLTAGRCARAVLLSSRETQGGPAVTLTERDLLAIADAVAERLTLRLGQGQRLLDRPALAERLGISQRGVTSLVSRGELPPGYRVGGVRRWDWEEGCRHLNDRTQRKPRRGRGRYDREVTRESPGMGRQS